MKYTTREATTADAIAVRDVHITAVSELGVDAYTDDQIEAWAHPRDPADYPLAEDDVYAVVAERDGDVIGFGWMKLDADDYLPTDGEITAVYVQPSVGRDGIGSSIYTELERHARQYEVSSLGLWASLNAVPFYEVHGYEAIAEREVEYGEVRMPVQEMHKQLSVDNLDKRE